MGSVANWNSDIILKKRVNLKTNSTNTEKEVDEFLKNTLLENVKI